MFVFFNPSLAGSTNSTNMDYSEDHNNGLVDLVEQSLSAELINSQNTDLDSSEDETGDLFV